MWKFDGEIFAGASSHCKVNVSGVVDTAAPILHHKMSDLSQMSRDECLSVDLILTNVTFYKLLSHGTSVV